MSDRKGQLAAVLCSQGIETRTDEALSGHCSWRIGGPADLLVEPASVAEVQQVVRLTRGTGLPLVVIGDGSNLLFNDAGIRGVVMKIGRRLGAMNIDGQTVIADGGAWIPCLARRTAKAGLTGLEHTIGIPGTLGGLVLMNGGSLRQAIGTSVQRVWLVDRNGNEQMVLAADCDFSYRHSALQGREVIIVRAELRLERGEPRAIRHEMLEILHERRSKFPLRQPNCGSVFLSNPDHYHIIGPPGKVIEEAGLKGYRIGDAQVSPMHANFIVNLGQATAADVLALIKHIRQTVHDRNDHWLGCEVRHVDEQGRLQPASEVCG